MPESTQATQEVEKGVKRAAAFLSLHAKGYFRSPYQLNPLAVFSYAARLVTEGGPGNFKPLDLTETDGKEVPFSISTVH